MSYALVPNDSAPSALPPVELDGGHVPFHADPILAAIEQHDEAWGVFQVALSEAREQAETAMGEALKSLLGTACATRAGSFALLRHLRWWLAEEDANAAAYSDDRRIAQAREGDLTLLLSVDGVRRLPVALPLGRLPGPYAALPTPITIEAGQPPAPALVRLSRVANSAGELLACLVLVAGGCVFTGLATLL